MRRWFWAWAEALLAVTIVLAIIHQPAITDALAGRPSPDTRLSTATSSRDQAAFEEALAAGARVIACDAQGHTALALAALSGDTRIVQRLVELGANVNSADHRGFTPLMYAAVYDHLQITRILLEHGAEAGRTTYSSRLSALDLAKLNESGQVADLLSAYPSQ